MAEQATGIAVSAGPTNGVVIGAMKSGTTTLYADLRRVPGITVPAKELSFFQRPAAEVTRAAYDQLFEVAEPENADPVLCRLDISTTYSMWPDVPDVPERAAEILEGQARIVYLVRNPVERAISHHHHMVARGATSASFVDYLDEDPGMIAYGRYDQQTERWEQQFGPESVLVVRLDDYSSDWSTVAPRILAHLGVSFDITGLEPPGLENATDAAKVFTGRSRQLAESGLFKAVYRNGVRRVIPERLRTGLRNLALPEPPERPDAPDLTTLSRLASEFEPAVRFVADRTGTEPWDLDKTLQRIAVES